jgi:hypothetical protein
VFVLLAAALLTGTSSAAGTDTDPRAVRFNNTSHALMLLLSPLPPLLLAAALLMGANSATGTDTDPLAVRAAEANAGLNGMQGRFAVVKCGANLNDPDPLLEVSVHAAITAMSLSLAPQLSEVIRGCVIDKCDVQCCVCTAGRWGCRVYEGGCSQGKSVLSSFPSYVGFKQRPLLWSSAEPVRMTLIRCVRLVCALPARQCCLSAAACSVSIERDAANTIQSRFFHLVPLCYESERPMTCSMWGAAASCYVGRGYNTIQYNTIQYNTIH